MYSETDSVTTQLSPDPSIQPADNECASAVMAEEAPVAEEQAVAYEENPTALSAAGFLARENQDEEGKERASVGEVLYLTLLGVLCFIVFLILACNVTLIVKASLNPDVPPSLFGHTAMIVNTDVMEGSREDSFGNGAMILVRVLSDEEKQQLREGDIVTYRAGAYYMTLRITGVSRTADGTITAVLVLGDNESVSGNTINVVELSDIIGVCRGSVEGLGSFFLFIGSPRGALIFVGIPVLLYVIYDFVSVTIYNRRLRKREEEAAAAEAAAQGGGQGEVPAEAAGAVAAAEVAAGAAVGAGIVTDAVAGAADAAEGAAGGAAAAAPPQGRKKTNPRVQKPYGMRGEPKEASPREEGGPRYPRGEHKPPQARRLPKPPQER